MIFGFSSPPLLHLPHEGDDVQHDVEVPDVGHAVVLMGRNLNPGPLTIFEPDLGESGLLEQAAPRKGHDVLLVLGPDVAGNRYKKIELAHSSRCSVVEVGGPVYRNMSIIRARAPVSRRRPS